MGDLETIQPREKRNEDPSTSVKFDGARLGPVGARIVANVVLGIIDADEDSYFNVNGQPWSPNARGEFGIADLLSRIDEDPSGD